MNILGEVKTLCEKLLDYVSDNKKNEMQIKENCLKEIEFATILISSKNQLSPLSAHNLLQSMLEKNLSREVKLLIEGGQI